MFLQKENQPDFPIISDRIWHLHYYFSVFRVTPRYIGEDKVKRLHHVWVVTAHHGNPISPQTKEILDRDFTVKKSFHGAGCSAVLYAKKRVAQERNSLRSLVGRDKLHDYNTHKIPRKERLI